MNRRPFTPVNQIDTSLDKQVYDLTAEDLNQFPVWYFPMNETVEDEATVRPLHGLEPNIDDLQIIVRCRFKTANGAIYLGYLYPGINEIDLIKPMLWAGDLCVTFWNGMSEPSADYLQKVRESLPANAWPIRYESEPTECDAVMDGNLEGLYFIDDGNVQCVLI